MLGIVKLLFLAGLVALGIVLLPQNWVNETKDAFAGAKNYLSKTLEEKTPEVKESVVLQAEETKKEAGTLYDKFKEEKWPGIRDWLVEKFIY
ncbi:MAG: hypothetical protein WA103_01915 [Minisyncoccales bacterium]